VSFAFVSCRLPFGGLGLRNPSSRFSYFPGGQRPQGGKDTLPASVASSPSDHPPALGSSSFSSLSSSISHRSHLRPAFVGFHDG
jgi:hypothetical protein